MTSSVNKSRYFFLWRNDSDYQNCQLEVKDNTETLIINSIVNKVLNYNQYYNIRIVKQGTSIKTYVDDVQVHSETYADVGITNANVGIVSWSDNPIGYIKNLKIKPL